ncbi:hypothetical protein BC936DRAFT_144936 [Jimgerdemannia flammicorona]|uniref:F-box domain-containing protein n=1 Tax=Jimgerdemannia flammicorona TaxID=994334 RepID=A0A433DBB8_9FUNG|nr:hypothetical protein BC936DRAFT_144936 [Jimgerdemannia flammicorona]
MLNLDPNTLRKIFLYLIPTKPYPTNEVPFDLFACALVCSSWHRVAYPLLDDIIEYENFRELFYNNPYGSEERARLAEIFAESRRSGLYYHRVIERVFISTNYLGDRRTVRALAAIVKLIPPNLSRLSFDLQLTTPATTALLNTLLISLTQPINQNLTHLHFDGDAGGPKNHRHLAQLISALSPYLHSIKLSNYTIELATINALSSCLHLRELDLDHVEDAHQLPHTPPWPELRIFRYAQTQRAGPNRTVVSLGSSCPQLESFTFEADSTTILPAINDVSLAALLAGALRLKRVRLARVGYVDYNFLADILIPKGSQLEHIDLEGCIGIDSFVTPCGEQRLWPTLRSLSLDGCRRVGPGCVRKIVAACPGIELLTLPEHLVDVDQREMGMCEFLKLNKVWRRVGRTGAVQSEVEPPQQMAGEQRRGVKGVWAKVKRMLN